MDVKLIENVYAYANVYYYLKKYIYIYIMDKMKNAENRTDHKKCKTSRKVMKERSSST